MHYLVITCAGTTRPLATSEACGAVAEEIFEIQVMATHWMSTPNKAPGGTAPII